MGVILGLYEDYIGILKKNMATTIARDIGEHTLNGRRLKLWPMHGPKKQANKQATCSKRASILLLLSLLFFIFSLLLLLFLLLFLLFLIF